MISAVIFRLARSKLALRFDPRANQPLVQQLRKRLSEGPYPATQLHYLADFTKSTVTEIGTEDVYVGLENIDGAAGEYVVTKDKETISSAATFKRGDILFPKLRPYLNKTHLAQFDGLCSTEFHVLKVHGAMPEYVAAMLRSESMVQLAAQLMTGNTLPRLQTADIENLAIPLPTMAVQQQVVDLMRQAYAEKKRLEDEAAKLLSSVDGVMYQHLGIELPAFKSNDLTARIFRVRLSAIDHRFDAPANWDDFQLQSPRFASVPLRQVAAINPFTDFSNIDSDKCVSFVPMECVDEVWGAITDHQPRNYGESKGYTEFQDGDVLWAKITPCMQNGKSAIAKALLQKRGFGSTEFHVFRVDAAQMDAGYLLALLRLKYLLQHAENHFGGSAGHQRVEVRFFEKLSLPLPPLAIQQQIANEISEIKMQSASLQKQANAQLKAAKAKVEKMILGEME